MKKNIIRISVIALILNVGLVSCSSDGASDSTEQVAETIYYCPMECEGEKTYNEPGSCAVCGMDLIEKE
ncbi:MAG: heavy metal-binding domain-containing protein [Vicingaceae bacterium]|nr:heavy metal-binding domain-containing protein [Vicingaceae bacterium]